MGKLKDLLPEAEERAKKQKLEELTAKQFKKAVDDEWDVETLDLMMAVIQDRKDLIQKMISMGKGRTVVKGFRK